MALNVNPLVPGDLYEAASRLSARADATFASIAAPRARLDALRSLWDETAALGWHAVMVPEACGGAGGSLQDAVALAEGLGRSAFPMSSAVICGVIAELLANANGQGRQLLSEFAAGSVRPVAALDGYVGQNHGFSGVRASNGARSIELGGELRGIDCLPEATHGILGCNIDGQPAVLLVDLKQAAVTVRRHERMDRRPTIDLAFDRLTIAGDHILMEGSAGQSAIERSAATGTLLVCAEAVGCMGLLLEQTIEYLSKRVQFGAPLSTLQVLRHRVAELYVSYEHSRAMVEHVLRQSDDGGIPARQLDLTKMRLNEAARRFAALVTQLHGGMGVSDELPASRLCKRLFMLNFEFRNVAELEASLLETTAA